MKTLTFVLLGAMAVVHGVVGSPHEERGYIAHEWGTFTSVQSADGVPMPWNPLNAAELPDFVYSLAWPEGKNAGKQNVLAGKNGFFALQRMETPVIYFYSDEPRTVDVSVKFPKGTITEWYPQATRANAFGEAELAKGRVERGEIRWKGVQILAKGDFATPLRETSGSHYYAARETGANPIRIPSRRGSETEKFLFYRGVGSFETPLRVLQQGDRAEAIELRNTGAQKLHHLLVYQVQGNRAAWTVVPELAPNEGKTVRIRFDRDAVLRNAFQNTAGAELRQALVAQGLFEREAAAMVKTWEESWFTEEGVRVLYILPTEWTDEILPLNITPTPAKTARVMVGRAELVTPAMETALLQELVRYASGEEVSRAQAVENVRKLGLGRFSEAVVRRVLTRNSLTREFSNRAWELLEAVNKIPGGEQLARN